MEEGEEDSAAALSQPKKPERVDLLPAVVEVGVPQIRVDVDEDEAPRRQSVLAQKGVKIKSSEKVKPAGTETFSLAVASILHYLRR